VDEETFPRQGVHGGGGEVLPGKAKASGDRKPDADEIAACRAFMDEEGPAPRAEQIIPVGGLSPFEQINGGKLALAEVVGGRGRWTVAGVPCEGRRAAAPLRRLDLAQDGAGQDAAGQALEVLGEHPVWRETFAGRRKAAGG
jgi:uracil-DNA glycosylase